MGLQRRHTMHGAPERAATDTMSSRGMLTLRQRKMAVNRMSDALDTGALKPPVPELERMKTAKAALQKARDELSSKNKKMLERYMKEAKKLEKEEEQRKKSLEKDLKSTQSRQLTNMQKDHKRRRKTLRKEAGKNIDGYREVADQMEHELKELESKLQTEASTKRTSLQDEVLSAKAHKFERILKRKLALEVAVYEELHAVQYAEMKHFNSMELAGLELRHAAELGKDLRAQAESENCDGNPTISRDLAERQRQEHTDLTTAHANRLKALADHHNLLLDNLFTVYHGELAAVRESTSTVQKDWSKRVPLEAFGPETPEEELPPHLVTMSGQPGQWGGLEGATVGAVAVLSTWEEKVSRKGSGLSLASQSREEIASRDMQPMAAHHASQPVLVRAATTQSTTRPQSMYDSQPIEPLQPTQIKRTASLDTAKPAPAPAPATVAPKKPPPTSTPPYRAPPEARNAPATLPKPAKQPAPEPVAPVAKAAEAPTQSKMAPALASQSQPLNQVRSTSSQSSVAAAPPPQSKPAPPPVAQSKPVFVPVTEPTTQPKPILAPAPAPAAQPKPILAPAPAPAAQPKPILAPAPAPTIQSKPTLAPAPAPAPIVQPQTAPAPAIQSQPPPRPTAPPPMKQQPVKLEPAPIAFNTPVAKSKASNSNFNTWGGTRNPYKEAWMAPLPPAGESDFSEGFLASASVRDADAGDVVLVQNKPIESVELAGTAPAPAKKQGMLASVFAKGLGGKKVLPPHPSFYTQHPPPRKEQRSFEV